MATFQTTPPTGCEEVAPLTEAEAAVIFDRAARRYLKMSKDEFLSRMASGYFQEHPELERRLDSVLFYLPLIRR